MSVNPRVAARAFSTRVPAVALDPAELLHVPVVFCTVKPALGPAPTSSVLLWRSGCLLRSDDLPRHPAGCLQRGPQRETDTLSAPRYECLSVSTAVCSDAGGRVVFVLDRARARAPLRH
ncbi:hypothetical protein NDU88_005608 [Pleurodeles waltl]|uniref:Uncharacterized protein n=1 Tax=Pleurodeles waltl TaxID=8319 RepID=A0AAV7PP28_PLEWA|nr:hypothetical protein NDU88_005608 [Pleurodeles waltl]